MRDLFNMTTPHSKEHDISSILGMRYAIARAMDKCEDHDILVGIVNLFLSEDRPETGVLATRLRDFRAWRDFKAATYDILQDLEERNLVKYLQDSNKMPFDHIIQFAEFLAIFGYNLEGEAQFRDFEIEEMLGVFYQYQYMRDRIRDAAHEVVGFRDREKFTTFEMEITGVNITFDFENDPDSAFNAVRNMMTDGNDDTAAILIAAHATYFMSK